MTLAHVGDDGKWALALGLGKQLAGICRASGTGWFGRNGRQVVCSCTDSLKSKHSLLETSPGYPLGDFTVDWYSEYRMVPGNWCRKLVVDGPFGRPSRGKCSQELGLSMRGIIPRVLQ